MLLAILKFGCGNLIYRLYRVISATIEFFNLNLRPILHRIILEVGFLSSISSLLFENIKRV